MSARWRLGVNLARRSAGKLTSLAYSIARDGETMSIDAPEDARGLPPPPDVAGALLVETGVVWSDAAGVQSASSYVLIVRRGSVATFLVQRGALSLDVPRLDAEANGDARPPAGVPVVFGPSAALTLAEESLLRDDIERNARFAVTESLVSPYPPHVLPGGWDHEHPPATLDPGARLDALLLRTASWARPFAALDADHFASLRLRCAVHGAMPRRALYVDSMIPLTGGSQTIEWEAAVSIVEEGRMREVTRPVRFFASVALLAGSIRAAAGGRSIGVVRDPIAGDHFGLAPPLLSSLRAGELLEVA
jgi:hypothetical protein